MFNIIIATHGQLAEEFLNVLQSLFGHLNQIEALGLKDQGVVSFGNKVDQLLATTANQSVLVLCDLAGGTPFNEFAKRSNKYSNDFFLFGGVSLPVLIEALNLRMQNQSLDQVVEKLRQLTPLTMFKAQDRKNAEDE